VGDPGSVAESEGAGEAEAAPKYVGVPVAEGRGVPAGERLAVATCVWERLALGDREGGALAEGVALGGRVAREEGLVEELGEGGAAREPVPLTLREPPPEGLPWLLALAGGKPLQGQRGCGRVWRWRLLPGRERQQRPGGWRACSTA
jgi:hypothetical protein